jgi:hypothetical protein
MQALTVDGEQITGYAYHLDAGLLGEFLKQYACRLGVNHVVDTITHVNQTEDGSIASLTCSSGAVRSADLFIDCTGFQELLIDKTLHEPFDDYSAFLRNNKALALRCPYQDKAKEMAAYTNCTAMSAGWIWQIPLYQDIGTGYVYSDGFISDDQAEQELRGFLGEDRVKEQDVLPITMRVGQHQRTWVKNCVAIGLSSGFIEPLESTGLYIAQYQVERLVYSLLSCSTVINAPTVAMHNKGVSNLMQSIRDFLVCHYAFTARDDTEYWRTVREETTIPDTLVAILNSSFGEVEQYARSVAPHGSFDWQFGWQAILLGMNYRGMFDLFITDRHQFIEANKQDMILAEECYDFLQDNRTKATNLELPSCIVLPRYSHLGVFS